MIKPITAYRKKKIKGTPTLYKHDSQRLSFVELELYFQFSLLTVFSVPQSLFCPSVLPLQLVFGFIGFPWSGRFGWHILFNIGIKVFGAGVQ